MKSKFVAYFKLLAFFFTVSLIFSCSQKKEQTVTVIPHTFATDQKSSIFKVSVDNVEIPVTVVPNVDSKLTQHIANEYKKLPEYCWIEDRYITAHYIHFTSDTIARIRITITEPINNFTIYPKRAKTNAKIDGNTLTFSINQKSCKHYLVSVNKLPMFIVLPELSEKEKFATDKQSVISLNEFIKDKSTKDYSVAFKTAIAAVNKSGKTLYIPAGEYITDAINIIDCSNFNIWFDTGALVKIKVSPAGKNIQNAGILIKNSNNIGIYGEGCLDHQAYENFHDGTNDYHFGFPGYDFYFKFENIPENSIYLQSPLMLIYSKNITIDGLFIRNGRNYNVNSRHCDNVIIRNVKVITPAGSVPENTDGINIGSYRNFLIEDCFVYCNDDVFSMGHNLLPYDNRYSDKLEINGLVGWNPRANAIRLGWASNTYIGDMIFKRCDFSGMDDSAMQLHKHTSTGKEPADSLCYGTVRFENCTFDDVNRYTRQMIDVQNICIKSFELVNVTFDAVPKIKSTIYGDKKNKMGQLLLENVWVGGKKITSDNFNWDIKNIDKILIK